MADGNNRIVRIDDMSGAGWTTFGSIGNGVNQFSFPADLAFDSQGRMVIADYDNDRIVRIDDMSGAGWVTFGTSGNGVGQFDQPYRLAIDSSDRIYVVDSGNHRVVRIDNMTGSAWVSFGSQGSGVGQFEGIQGIGIDTQGRIHVTDYVNDRIARFDDMTGANWTTFGTSGSGVGQFDSAADIVFNNSQMLVADRGGRVIQAVVMSVLNWVELPLNTVQSATYDSNGRIYTVNQNNNRIDRFNSIAGDGATNFGTSGSGVGQFNSPSTIRLGP